MEIDGFLLWLVMAGAAVAGAMVLLYTVIRIGVRDGYLDASRRLAVAHARGIELQQRAAGAEPAADTATGGEPPRPAE